MITIGITGTLGSGKGTAVKYLVEKYGFTHYSSTEFISKEVARRGLPDNRSSMHEVGNSLRGQYGPGHIVEQLYEQATIRNNNAVIESIRAIGEVTSLRSKSESFYLLAVDAEPKIRYERIRGRKSSKDNVSFEKFLSDEQREMNDQDPSGMNISACMKLADWLIYNNGDVEALHAAVDKVIQPLLKK